MNSTPSKVLALEAFREQFNGVLAGIMRERTEAARHIDQVYAELLEEMSFFMARGGKRLRPYLTYLAYRGLGGRDEGEIIRLSASQEFYHNAWLIHDDIIDRDIIRYGGPNIAGAYRVKLDRLGVADSSHVAEAMALIAGDINLSIALDLIASSTFAPDLKLAAARRAQRLVFEVAGGEMLDVLLPTMPAGQFTAERVTRIYHYKTAAYSFDAPLQIGAIIAGQDKARLTAISAAAIPLGIAFQLADDLLGVFGNEDELGKPVLSDMREGKRTMLLLYGLQQADSAARARLEKLMGNPEAGYRHLLELRKILEDCGARAQTEALARTNVTQALAALAHIGFNAEVTTILNHLAEFTIQRRF